MLDWYRDSKRRLMTYQLENTQRLAKEYIGPDARVILYLPGEAYTQQDWDEAVATASGNGRIRLMTDNDWLMDYALAHNCVLQYTGAENAAEVGRIVLKLKARDSDAYKLMWAENAGFEAIGRNPQWLAEVITAFDLRGVDLCWTNWLFEEDFVTPSPTFAAFEECCQGIRNYYATSRRYVSRPNLPTALEESSPGVFELPCIADTRLIAMAQNRCTAGILTLRSSRAPRSSAACWPSPWSCFRQTEGEARHSPPDLFHRLWLRDACHTAGLEADHRVERVWRKLD